MDPFQQNKQHLRGVEPRFQYSRWGTKSQILQIFGRYPKDYAMVHRNLLASNNGQPLQQRVRRESNI